MQFQLAKLSVTQSDMDKLQATIKNSVEKFDFDSSQQAGNGKWLAMPTDGIVYHNLQTVPTWAVAQIADESDGNGWSVTAITSVTRTSITIEPGAKAFCRVLVNK